MQTTTTSKTYAIDPAHSHVGFSIRHVTLTKVPGTFHGLAGTVTLGDQGEIPAAIEATINVESVDTREEKRDAHIKAPDFFDAASHPMITFRSTSITGSGSTFTAVGDLTLRGVTKSITLAGSVAGHVKDPWGNDRIGWSATTRLNRKDFGLTFAGALESGAAILGDDVDVSLEIQAIPAK